MTMMENFEEMKKKVFSELAKRGQAKRREQPEKYNSDYYRALQQKSVEARKRNQRKRKTKPVDNSSLQ
jgi:hypothetical protein